MADKDLTRKIIKALNPNVLLAQETKQSQYNIARNIESSAKSKASLNYIRDGVKTIFRSKANDTKDNRRRVSRPTRKAKKAKKELFGKSNTQITNNSNFSDTNPMRKK